MSSLDDFLNSLPTMEEAGGLTLSPEETKARYEQDAQRSFDEKKEILSYQKELATRLPLLSGTKFVAIFIDKEGNEYRKCVMQHPLRAVQFPVGLPYLLRYEEDIKHVEIPIKVFRYDGKVTYRYQQKTGFNHYVYVEE